ncbi:MAG: CRISPR-associated helicase Cas3' [Cyanobacteria bacterium J06592_8]
MNFLARLTKENKAQLLKTHLKSVAQGCVEVSPEQFREVAYYAGLWHDLGKYREVWQKYLKGNPVTQFERCHSAHGAALAWSMSEGSAIAFIISGHHSGLPNQQKFITRDFEKYSEGWQIALENAEKEIPEFKPEKMPDINLPVLRREFAIRMIFSMLVDCDRLDAMNFGKDSKTPYKQGFRLLDIFNGFNSLNVSDLNSKRSELLERCLEYSTSSRGLFRLTAPTGLGKTHSSFSFAASHHNHHKMNGIIYVGPFKSVIGQNASVARSMFGEDNVLEHHSGFDPGDDEKFKDYKFDCERWDKPVICTTGVQFYESLFSNKPGQCRKLHQIANRVIIIDEAQTIPLDFSLPILDALETLIKDWGCTVVLMSATQPVFERLEMCDHAVDIVSKKWASELFLSLQRCTYKIDLSGWDYSEIEDKLTHSQNLLIFNTVNTAKFCFEAIQHRPNSHLLTTEKCPAERADIIAAIKQSLKDGEPVTLVSTQLIEAGVDIDFPAVFRQLAPLDSIIQSGGRCNREGRLTDATTTVFSLIDNKYPDADYAYRIQVTQKILENSDALNKDCLKSIKHYFLGIFNKLRSGGEDIQNLRKIYNFPEVNTRFKLINDNKIPLIVPYKEGKSLIEKYKDRGTLVEGRLKIEASKVDKGLSAKEWREIQIYQGLFRV